MHGDTCHKLGHPTQLYRMLFLLDVSHDSVHSYRRPFTHHLSCSVYLGIMALVKNIHHYVWLPLASRELIHAAIYSLVVKAYLLYRASKCYDCMTDVLKFTVPKHAGLLQLAIQ